jgi:hypothetical protein
MHGSPASQQAPKPPGLRGQSFGSVGQYEELDGTAAGEIDPRDPLNAVIQDIEPAPRNSRGMVEYSMDFSILKPVDTSRGNHTILYDVVNRGNKSSPSLNIGGSANNPGDGFLESEGYTLVWSGWEGDITTGIKINLPVAKNPDGSEITDSVRAEYILGACHNRRCNGSARLRGGKHQQCGRHPDKTRSPRRSERGDRQQPVGVCRLLGDAVPWNAERRQGVSQRRFRHEPYLRAGLYREKPDCDRDRLRRDARLVSARRQ